MTKKSDKSKELSEELKEQELDEVTGGGGSQSLVAHELTHIQQQKGSSYIGETEKNLGVAEKGKLSRARGKKIVAQAGDGEI